MLKRFLKNDSGASALVFALAAPLFIGGITLAVELGNWQQKKSKLQDLADASAIAAAQEILILGDDAHYTMAAKGHAFENGFSFITGNMTISNPPASGKYAGNANMVEVVVTNDQEMFFSKYFGNKAITQKSRATAIILEGVEACLLSLAPTAWPGIGVGGASNVTLNGCGVHANSTTAGAIDVTNITADCISSVGGITTTSGTTITQCDGVTQPYSRTIRDPYDNLEVPAGVASMPCLSPVKSGKDTAISPGRYCSNVSSSRLLHLTQPGVYIFDGADLGTSSSNSVIFGRDVTLIFMNGGLFGGANGGTVDLTPQTSGYYAAISMYYDRDTTPMNSFVRINGNATSKIEGVIYGPTVDIRMNGGANASSGCLKIIANTVDFMGNAHFTNTNCKSLGARQVGGEVGAALVE